jgi:hypothetical protein
VLLVNHRIGLRTSRAITFALLPLSFGFLVDIVLNINIGLALSIKLFLPLHNLKGTIWERCLTEFKCLIRFSWVRKCSLHMRQLIYTLGVRDGERDGLSEEEDWA